MYGGVRKDREEIPKLLLTYIVAARSSKSSVVLGMIEKLDSQNVRRSAKRQRGDAKTVGSRAATMSVGKFGSAGRSENLTIRMYGR
jgi:hypothetical protein